MQTDFIKQTNYRCLSLCITSDLYLKSSIEFMITFVVVLLNQFVSSSTLVILTQYIINSLCKETKTMLLKRRIREVTKVKSRDKKTLCSVCFRKFR